MLWSLLFSLIFPPFTCAHCMSTSVFLALSLQYLFLTTGPLYVLVPLPEILFPLHSSSLISSFIPRGAFLAAPPPQLYVVFPMPSQSPLCFFPRDPYHSVIYT